MTEGQSHVSLSADTGHATEADTARSETAALVAQLLAGLARMAARSWRSQADLGTVVGRAGIRADATALGAAIDELQRLGFIKGLIPLSDGGLLVTVTGEGLNYARRLTVAASGDTNTR